MRADPIEAARRAAGDAYDVLGELGREGDSVIAFLARENDTGYLVALTLDGVVEATQPHANPGFSVRRLLDPSIPAAESRCPQCGGAITTWARFCPSCSADLAGVEDWPIGAGASALSEAIAGKYELLGDMQRTDGGAPVHFAREQDTQRIVALRLDTAEPSGSGAGPQASVTQRVRTLAAAQEDRHAPPAGGAGARGDPGAATRHEPGSRIHFCPACDTVYDAGTVFCPRDGTALKTKTRGQDMAGRIIAGRYRVLARLGAGGMGQVYKAEHIRMGSLCAIKLMNPALERDPEALGRFAREAAHASRISHANIARVYDFGETQDGVLFLAMEFAEGETLSKIIARDGPLPPSRAAEIARQVADALAAAHELGTVHRDIKPDNIIVNTTRSGRETAKIVDFGIAKALTGAPDEQVTRAGFVVGNPKYMSPEQLMGEPVDERGDVYSLGCVLFEMLAGQAAFSATGGAAMLTKRLVEPPPRLRDHDPDVPEDLDAIVNRAMARERDGRFESAGEFRDALAAVVDSIVTGRSRIHTDGSWMAVKPVPEPGPAAVATPGRARLSPGRFLPLAGTALLLVAVTFQLSRLGAARAVGPEAPDSVAMPGAAIVPTDDTATATPAAASAHAVDSGRTIGGTGDPTPALAAGRVAEARSDPPTEVRGSSPTVRTTPRTADTPSVRRQPQRQATEGRATETQPATPPPPEFRAQAADSIARLLLAVQVRAERREYAEAFEVLGTARARVDALLAAFPSQATLLDLDRRIRDELDSVDRACLAWRDTQIQRGQPAPVCR